MSTHLAVATTTPKSNGGSTDPSGSSYAHAVLNFKGEKENGGNKENIEESIEAKSLKAPKNSSLQITAHPNQQPLPEVADDDDSFTQVVNHSRKERKHEKKKEKLKETHPHKPVVNGNADKRETTNTAPTAQTQKDKEILPESKKVYVEAPLPTTNPWQANRIVNSTKEVNVEKRVLLPHKQVDVNVQTTPAVVRAPKDRRKYNHKPKPEPSDAFTAVQKQLLKLQVLQYHELFQNYQRLVESARQEQWHVPHYYYFQWPRIGVNDQTDIAPPAPPTNAWDDGAHSDRHCQMNDDYHSQEQITNVSRPSTPECLRAETAAQNTNPGALPSSEPTETTTPAYSTVIKRSNSPPAKRTRPNNDQNAIIDLDQWYMEKMRQSDFIDLDDYDGPIQDRKDPVQNSGD